ncbi:Diphthine methyltransferase [Colletotrichum chlorophyti]|uniref:methylated diphthine methylhydrolase n=1 Tax=Colletotrichum chlorophyti TaxID=708187 RepID=A0A1Q8S109_9PEZI|nr:Diphthine methyltransferase [Colletotrichum chlorophyti]
MSDSNNLIASKQSIVLDLPPSCVEFCLSHPTYFVVGTYNLVKDEEPAGDSENTNSSAKRPQNRNGSLALFQLTNGTIRHVQTVSHPSALLDLHFCPLSSNQDILAVVSSTGTLSIFRLDPVADALEPLKHLATSRIPDVPDGVLFLSGVWGLNEIPSIAVTTSAGEVRIVRLDDSWQIIEDNSEAVIAHTLEAWTVAFSPNEEIGSRANASQQTPFVVYSGGDDSTLRYTSCGYSSGEDSRDEVGVEALYPPLKIDGHGAGVTAILPISVKLADGSRLLVTGCYDDTIRVIAVQPPHETYGLRKFKSMGEKNLGGGVWRLKLIDVQKNDGRCRVRVLASCMHAGARVVALEGPLDGEEWVVSVLARFEEHKSMNYGSDTVPGFEDGRLVCVSTSFYDKLLCLWEVELV